MNEPFQFGDIYCLRGEDDPFTFFYLPGDPGPELSPAGRPTLTLFVSDREARLLVGTRWAVENPRLEELRAFIVEHYEDIDVPALIRLSMMPVDITGVTLSLGDGAGGFKEIKTVRSSGYTPFSAIFNQVFSAGDKAGVIAALNGREGFLTVTYKGSFSASATGPAALPLERTTDVSSWFPGGAGGDHILITNGLV